MSVTEFQRHQVFQWFEESMSSERAAIMMDLLPPVGWGDIATKTDLAMLRADMSALRSEVLGEIKSSQSDLLMKLFFGMVASNATLVVLVFTAMRLA